MDNINLVAATDDWGTGVVNTAVLNNILQMASDRVDALVSAVYQVPFTINPIPVKIRTAAAIFAVEMLYARRLTPDEKNPMTPQANELRKELMDINRGLLSLDYQSRRAFPPIVTHARLSRANDNTF